jgi:hypothetical protein
VHAALDATIWTPSEGNKSLSRMVALYGVNSVLLSMAKFLRLHGRNRLVVVDAQGILCAMLCRASGSSLRKMRSKQHDAALLEAVVNAATDMTVWLASIKDARGVVVCIDGGRPTSKRRRTVEDEESDMEAELMEAEMEAPTGTADSWRAVSRAERHAWRTLVLSARRNLVQEVLLRVTMPHNSDTASSPVRVTR